MTQPTSPFDDPEQWRQRAAESRRMAEQLDDPVQKQTLLEIADAYEQLAARIEETNKSK